MPSSVLSAFSLHASLRKERSIIKGNPQVVSLHTETMGCSKQIYTISPSLGGRDSCKLLMKAVVVILPAEHGEGSNIRVKRKE